MLEICLDGICLWGNSFFEPLQEKVLNAIKSARLHREHFGSDFFWRFENEPKGGWELTWTGFHEFTK